jgi:hypothetical protein
MSANAYHFITHWRVPGTVEEVAESWPMRPDLPRWWPAVYLDVQETKPGDDEWHRQGSIAPYHGLAALHAALAVSRHGVQLPPWLCPGGVGRFRRAWGVGAAAGRRYVDVTYDWQLRAEKPLLRRLSFLLRPVFAANHRWAMARGEESLRLELARRTAPAHERGRIPPPPGPTSLRTCTRKASTASSRRLCEKAVTFYDGTCYDRVGDTARPEVKLDTCVSAALQPILAEVGHDVIWTGAWEKDPGDDEILAFARREGRVLVTLDKDFGSLAVLRGQPGSKPVRQQSPVPAPVSTMKKGRFCDGYSSTGLCSDGDGRDTEAIQIRSPQTRRR